MRLKFTEGKKYEVRSGARENPGQVDTQVEDYGWEAHILLVIEVPVALECFWFLFGLTDKLELNWLIGNFPLTCLKLTNNQINKKTT